MHVVDSADRFDESTLTGGRFTLTIHFDHEADENPEFFAQLACQALVEGLKRMCTNVTAELVDHAAPSPNF